MIKMKFRALTALAGALLAYVGIAQGSLLPVGGAILTPPEPDPFLGVVVASLTQPFVTPPGVGQFSGTLTTTVILDDPSNPFANIGNPNPALHGLTFVYQLHNDATSSTSLGRMTNLDFSLFQTDVSYQPGLGLLPPTSTDRTSGAPTLGWSFTGAPLGLGRVLPGITSAPMVAQTNAPGFVSVLANVIDGSVLQVATFGPSPGLLGDIPEPGTLSLLLLGAFGFGHFYRRR